MPVAFFKRNNVLLKSSFWLLFLRCVGLLQSILTVKIYHGYFDTVHFAFLIVLFSYQIVFSFFDLGVGNAIVNRGIRFLVNKDFPSLSVLFQGSVGFLLGWTVVLDLFIVCLLQAPFFNDFVFPALGDRPFVRRIFFLCAVLSTLRCCFAVVNNYRLVFNQTYYNGMFDAAALLLSIAGQLLAVHFQLDFTWHVLIIFGFPVLGHLANLAHLVRHRPFLLQSFMQSNRLFYTGQIKQVLSDGSKFFFLQLASTFAFNSVPIILSLYAKTAEIAVYGILVRLFNPVSSLITVFLQPQWSFLSQSYLNGEYGVVKKSFRFSMAFVLAACAAYFLALYLFKDFIAQHIITGDVRFSLNILVLFCVSTVISNIGGVFGTILNALNEISFQVFFAALVVLFFGAEIFLFVPQYGLAAVLFFISLNVLVMVIIPSFIKTKRLLQHD